MSRRSKRLTIKSSLRVGRYAALGHRLEGTLQASHKRVSRHISDKFCHKDRTKCWKKRLIAIRQRSCCAGRRHANMLTWIDSWIVIANNDSWRLKNAEKYWRLHIEHKCKSSTNDNWLICTRSSHQKQRKSHVWAWNTGYLVPFDSSHHRLAKETAIRWPSTLSNVFIIICFARSRYTARDTIYSRSGCHPVLSSLTGQEYEKWTIYHDR